MWPKGYYITAYNDIWEAFHEKEKDLKNKSIVCCGQTIFPRNGQLWINEMRGPNQKYLKEKYGLVKTPEVLD